MDRVLANQNSNLNMEVAAKGKFHTEDFSVFEVIQMFLAIVLSLIL